MERLRHFWRERIGANRWPLARRWTLTAFLPSALAVLASAVMATVYVLLIPAYRPELSLIFIWSLAAAAVLALWLMGRRFLRVVTEPVEALTRQAERIRAGALGARSEKVRDDELGELSDSINAMSAALEQGEALQSQFIFSVSHELRTPLTAITGWIEAMSFDTNIQGESRRGLEIISREAQRLTKMVGELLEFTRIQDGRFNLNLDLVDLVAEVEDVLFTYSSLLRQEGVSICYACDETDIPPIQADPERIKQVLLNVLDNAVKHGKGGAVDVSVHLEGDEVVVRVRDHGPGIPEAELPHVKERFYKGSSRERGSGIGLAVCDEIVFRHGGQLQIENHSAGGVLVTVRLPVKP